MKLKRLVQAGCGVLACAAAVSALPHQAGHNLDRLRPRHSIAVGDVTKTVVVTVSLGPSTIITLGTTSTSDPRTEEDSSSTSASPSVPSVIVSTMTLTTEIATTIFPSFTPSPSFSSGASESTTTISTASSTTSSAASSTAPFSPPPAPTPTDPKFNPITAPAIGGGNPVLAQNAADAQALNRKFRELKLEDSCVDKDEACIGDSRAVCRLGTWRFTACTQPNTRCRAVPRMQTNGTALGCYTEADLSARFSSTGQSGNAFGE
ncbi:unnamed protein product [Rhizoctonia solani]|uniref:Carbohydrate-binding module family 19 domain-containing protein n=1 Tax=Rhizoctonia solani TaxID=456999 RepID=A0A8H3C1C2_9AGAM|nr:unnamed protein product [Rhizoctonia solani]